MSLSTGRYQLANGFKTLKQEWLDMENVWRDAVRQDFEQTYWDPLSIRLGSLLTAIDRLDQAMATMRSECD